MNSTPLPFFAALLLVGGRSRRMGRDKARLEWNGVPLWLRQMQMLDSLGASRCLIACRQEQGLQEESFLSAWQWLYDPPGDQLGPLGAIKRALDEAAMPLLVLAVDMPFMTAAFLQQQLLSPRMGAERGCFFRTEYGIEPLAGCYVPAMLPVLERRLARGELGLQKLIEECVGLGLAECWDLGNEERGLFANANTPDEWEHCQLPNTA
jgi:molybdenum cofactor guanylyltransferase